MPFSIWHADFVSNDGEELAPKRETRNSGNVAKWRDVKRVDIRPIYKIDKNADSKSAEKDRSGRIFSKYLRCYGYANGQ